MSKAWIVLLMLFYTPVQAQTAFIVTAPNTGRTGACYIFQDSFPEIHNLIDLKVYRVYFRDNDTTLILTRNIAGREGDTLHFDIPSPRPGGMGIIYATVTNNIGESCIGSQYLFAQEYTEAPEPPPLLPGLQGDYFNNQDFTAYVFTRTDAQINFNWDSVVPDPLIQPFTYSVLWRGFIQIPRDDQYTFYADVNDGVRLWVDNQQIINSWTNNGRSERSGIINLAAGVYPITMEYFQENGGSVAYLKWQDLDGIIPKELIPASALFH